MAIISERDKTNPSEPDLLDAFTTSLQEAGDSKNHKEVYDVESAESARRSSAFQYRPPLINGSNEKGSKEVFPQRDSKCGPGSTTDVRSVDPVKKESFEVEKDVTNNNEKQEEAREVSPNNNGGLKDRFDQFFRKCLGGSQKPPPAASLNQSILTFVGAFITLLLLSAFYSWVAIISEGKYQVMLAPFGALVTLQFGLTAAPPAQPRNAIYGEFIALPVSIICNAIPHNFLPEWIEIALAPAVGIGLKQYFGLTHPPAGAAAIMFSAMDYGWVHLVLFQIGVLISILASMVINNMNEKKQYPTYWSLLPFSTET